MRKPVIAGVLLLLFCSLNRADDKVKNDDPKTAKEQFEAIQKDRRDAMHEFSLAYSRAESRNEKNKVLSELYPTPQKYAKRFLQVAKDHPDDSFAIRSLVQAVTLGRNSAVFEEALSILSERYVESDEVGQVCQQLVYSPGSATEKFLRRVLEQSPHQDAKGLACISLARYRKQLVQMVEYIDANPDVEASYQQTYGKEFMASLTLIEPGEIQREAEQLFERVVKEFSDVKSFRGTLGESAERELFELRRLAIGQVAPEIEGEDIDGAKFKLTDYRGKVVVLDFWGDW